MLCRLCECPTADGAVRASQVDQLKLRKWALKALKSNGCEIEFKEVVEDDDFICYFCIWQCEYVARHESTDESLAWWPEEMRLDAAAKALRKNFLKGKVDQCWVELEKITVPESEDSEESADEVSSTSESLSDQGATKCIYCQRYFKDLENHIRFDHKRAIRCDNDRCPTYFLTLADKEAHMPTCYKGNISSGSTRSKEKCTICGKMYTSIDHLRRHSSLNHKDVPFACLFRGCRLYFKTSDEVKTHFDATHAKELEGKPHKCDHCPFRTKKKSTLKLHKGRYHMPKKLECDICKQKFATHSLLRNHISNAHSFYLCEICERHIKVLNFPNHARARKCACKKSFACSGLYQLHFEHCSKKKKNLKSAKVVQVQEFEAK